MTTLASFSTGRDTVEVRGNIRFAWGPKLTPEDLEHSNIFSVYENYLVAQADATDYLQGTFAKLCRYFKRIPTLDLINWIIQEANIIDEKHRLNFPVYAFI
jgi:hypothetical protein